jgi:hypothetical protein
MLLLILVPAFIVSGCQPSQPAASASPVPPVAEKTFEAHVVLGSGPFTLPDTTAGLADLSSYTSTLTLSLDGTKAGQPNKWSKTYVMLASKEPAARQLTIEKTGDLPDINPVFMAEMDGAAYERRGQSACAANAIVGGNSLAEQMEPAGFLGSVFGADEAGSATVNGVKASHYTFDEHALGQMNGAKSTGEVWVADKGGYVVKYLLTTKATADYFGSATEGTLTWDYELTNLNKPVTIKLPADCPPGMVDAPQLPDATNVVSVPGALTFDTSMGLADVAAFYQKKLPALGWKLVGQPTTNDTSALVDFTQKNKSLRVIILMKKGVTSVDIEAGAVQPSE